MNHTAGRWNGGVLSVRVTLDPMETRYRTSDEPAADNQVELNIDLPKLRLYMAKALRSESGKSVLGSGAIKFKRVRS